MLFRHDDFQRVLLGRLENNNNSHVMTKTYNNSSPKESAHLNLTILCFNQNQEFQSEYTCNYSCKYDAHPTIDLYGLAVHL